MSDKPVPTDQSNPPAAKGHWESPSVEELDFNSTESAFNATGTDGIYTS